MKNRMMAVGRWTLLLAGMLMSGAMPVDAQTGGSGGGTSPQQFGQQFIEATKTNMTPAKPGGMLKKGEQCMEYSHMPGSTVCCRKCKSGCCKWGKPYKISYWEPSAIIEVTCRSGYSMLGSASPRSGSNDAASPQTCVGANKPGNSRWFFDAHVWAINGGSGGLRHQGMGENNGARAKQCSLERGDDLPSTTGTKGYGMKWNKFTRGGGGGPGGSWEAYMSEKDQAWATDQGAGSSVATQKACQPGSNNLEGCWGPMNGTGWVNHPNPKVAAALVAWRAHDKALKAKKVSPAGQKGFKMMMEYPKVDKPGAYAQEMGATGFKQAACFKPGDAGPDWFGGQEPQAIPDFVKNLEEGKVATAVEVNPGVYVFTVWVYTSCIRWKIWPDPYPEGVCKYIGIS